MNHYQRTRKQRTRTGEMRHPRSPKWHIGMTYGRVVNQYIELRFRYESIYSGELNDPPHLRGKIIKKYRFVDGQILPWTGTASTDVNEPSL